MQATPILKVENIHLWRGERHLLRGISFEQHHGQLVRIAGANGSGKTTLLRVLAGLTQAEEGTVNWHTSAGQATEDSARSLLALLGHRDGLDDNLTAQENLDFALRLCGGYCDSAQSAEIFEELGLSAQANLPGKALSAGQRRRVGLARVFLSGAGAWLLDEPYTHLDADGRRVLNQRLERHLSSGGIVLLSTHDDTSLPRPASFEVAL